jgi:hypothetical protein
MRLISPHKNIGLQRDAYRNQGSNLDFLYAPEAGDWFRRVELIGATFGLNALAIAINKRAWSDFEIGCKADGIWAAIEQLIFLRGVSTLAGTLVPFKGPAPTNILLVQGSLDPATGMVGNGINQTLNLNVNNSSTPQNDNHNAVYVHTASSGGCYLGNTAVDGGNVIVPFNGDLFLRSRIGGGSPLVGDANATGFIGFSRSDSANLNIRVNSTNSTIAQVSQAPASGNLHTHSRGDGTAFSTVRESAISNGTNLNLALLDARMTTLFNTLVWT